MKPKNNEQLQDLYALNIYLFHLLLCVNMHIFINGLIPYMTESYKVFQNRKIDIRKIKNNYVCFLYRESKRV